MRILLQFLLALTVAVSAQEPKPAAFAKKANSGSESDFLLLPKDYQLLVAEAMNRFQTRDFRGAIIFADRADQRQPPTTWTVNVRAAVAIETKDFEQGEKLSRKVLEMDPDFFPAKFNLAEIPFHQKKYPEARAMWEKMLTDYTPEGGRHGGDGTPELLQYRIFLTYLLENNLPKAKESLDKIPFPSATPAYYYGNAAYEKAQGKEDKWKDWIRQAEYIWPESKRANFTDVLIQLGWMKDPRGGGETKPN